MSAQGEVGVDVRLVAVRVDDVGVRLSCKFSNARNHCSIDLAVAGDQMGFDAFFCGGFMKLQIWVCRV